MSVQSLKVAEMQPVKARYIYRIVCFRDSLATPSNDPRSPLSYSCKTRCPPCNLKTLNQQCRARALLPWSNASSCVLAILHYRVECINLSRPAICYCSSCKAGRPHLPAYLRRAAWRPCRQAAPWGLAAYSATALLHARYSKLVYLCMLTDKYHKKDMNPPNGHIKALVG